MIRESEKARADLVASDLDHGLFLCIMNHDGFS